MENILQFLDVALERKMPAASPLVSLCYAQSLDGSLSLSRQEATQISCAESRTLTHRLRAYHDAILVGVGTILTDDPLLNVRLVEGRNPQVVILDTHLRTPLKARLLRENPAPIWIATTEAAPYSRKRDLIEAGARVLILNTDELGLLHLASLLQCLRELGMKSVMVEGGAKVITSFLLHKLADVAVITLAPLFLGGINLIDLTVHTPNGRHAPLARLEDSHYLKIGEDILLWGAIQYP